MATAPVYARPGTDEYAPFYQTYVAKVPNDNLVALLEAGAGELDRLFDLPEARGNHAYAPGKWSLKEVLGHLIDAERVFSYRALVFGRGDAGPLPPFDENAWIPESGFGARTLADLRAEFRAVRAATVSLFAHFPPEAPTRTGVASGKTVSVRALGYIIAGHALHHAAVVRERYLNT